MSNPRAPLPYLTAYLQTAVAVLFILGYFGFLGILFLGGAKIADNLLELGKTLAVGLSGALGLLFAFLYLRSREAGTPDPTTTTTSTQTTTTPTSSSIPGAPHAPITPPTAAVLASRLNIPSQ
jgi:hypothetical protein